MTAKQKQCLLAYLGYYSGALDGIWGTQSKLGAKAFQKSRNLKETGFLNGETVELLKQAILEEDWWRHIRYFTPEEFACKCGKYCDGYPATMKRDAVALAEVARNHFGKPAIVVSGLRCKEWNRLQGGVENSQHMVGEAVDLRIQGVKAKDLLAFLKQQSGVRYAYAINETNVHFDIAKAQR